MPRPSILRVINPFFPLLLRFWKHICLLFLLLTVSLAAILYLLVLLPLKISDCHEKLYFREIDKHDSRESQWELLPNLRDTFMIKPSPWNQRPTRMIQDVIQLRTSDWRGSMNLYTDGTGRYPRQEYMIYVGGTPRNDSEPWHKKLWRDLSMFSLPDAGCVDPPEICNSFNQAFNTLLEQLHVDNGRTASWPLLRFIDCDNSPLMCDWLGVDAVMLIHVDTGHCEFSLQPSFSFTCDMKWTFIPLPLAEMPVHRNQKLADGRIVPRFPSALEQLSSVILFHGSWEGLEKMSVDPATVAWIRALRKDDQRGEMIAEDNEEPGELAKQFFLFDFISYLLSDDEDSEDWDA